MYRPMLFFEVIESPGAAIAIPQWSGGACRKTLVFVNAGTEYFAEKLQHVVPTLDRLHKRFIRDPSYQDPGRCQHQSVVEAATEALAFIEEKFEWCGNVSSHLKVANE